MFTIDNVSLAPGERSQHRVHLIIHVIATTGYLFQYWLGRPIPRGFGIVYELCVSHAALCSVSFLADMTRQLEDFESAFLVLVQIFLWAAFDTIDFFHGPLGEHHDAPQL